jgi:hypothetical protein
MQVVLLTTAAHCKWAAIFIIGLIQVKIKGRSKVNER